MDCAAPAVGAVPMPVLQRLRLEEARHPGLHLHFTSYATISDDRVAFHCPCMMRSSHAGDQLVQPHGNRGTVCAHGGRLPRWHPCGGRRWLRVNRLHRDCQWQHPSPASQGLGLSCRLGGLRGRRGASGPSNRPCLQEAIRCSPRRVLSRLSLFLPAASAVYVQDLCGVSELLSSLPVIAGRPNRRRTHT